MQTHVLSFHDGPSFEKELAVLQASGFTPSVGLMFCSVSQPYEAATQLLGQNGVTVVGLTSAGEIVNATVLEDAGVVLLMDIQPEHFVVHVLPKENDVSEEDVARQLGRQAIERFVNPIVLAFASGLSTDGEAIVRGIHAGAGRSLPLFGGLAGDDLRMEKTFVFSNDHVTDDGLIGLILDGDRYQAEGIGTSGWQTVGIEKTITHSEGNIVYAIDDEPALDVYEKYFSLHNLTENPQDIVREIGVHFPLSVRRDDGQMVIRAPLFSQNGNALVFAGTVPEGAKVMFCIPPSSSIVEQVVEESACLQQVIPEAEALILISCKARHSALGPLVEDEIEGLHDLWGCNPPLAGYFSYGEIGPAYKQRCDFHNETCMLVALREK